MCINIVQPIAGENRVSPDHAARAVASLVNRFEALRTVFVEDRDTAMGLRQHVLSSGTVQMELWTVPRFDQEASTMLSAELAGIDIGVHELPIRAVILAEKDTVRLVALRLSHMVADMWAAALLRTELQCELGLVNSDERAPRASQDWQPADQADFEASEAGVQLCDRSLQHWRDQMRRFPATLFFRPSAPPDSPRYCEGRVTSQAAFIAIHLLSRRYGDCSPAVVLMGAVVALIGAWSGTASVGLPVMVSNRHMRRSQGLVGQLVQMAGLCVEVAGRRFEDIVRSTAHASLVALRHGQYDIPRYRELQDEMAQERGGFEMNSWLNVRVWGDNPPRLSDDGRTHQAIVDLTDETSITWKEGFEIYNVKLGVLADMANGVARLTLRTDTTAIPRHDVSALLDSLDPLLIAALREKGLDQAAVERIVARPR
ncbi:condensation domain-containing protein [Micromonospora sp. CA-249363]|uniref:condensation domain-containing protein n=1 Tax=Micromonospora sp. CA-249363 TaxID=3239963 RepID=UPI003D8FE2AF